MTKQGIVSMMERMRAFWRKAFPASMPEEQVKELMRAWFKAFEKFEDTEVLDGISEMYMDGWDNAPNVKEIKRWLLKGKPIEVPEAEEKPLLVEFDGGYEGIIIPGLPDHMYTGTVSQEQIKAAKKRWRQ